MKATVVSGRSRLPAGEIRKASQRHSRRAETKTIRIEIPFRAGDEVRWRDRVGTFHSDVDDENAFVRIDGRLYRVARRELRPG